MNFENNFYKKIINKFFKMINYKQIRVGFEFSIIKKNCYISPHKDTSDKLLSLMLYFPPKDKVLSEKTIDHGTNFYQKKINVLSINSEII